MESPSFFRLPQEHGWRLSAGLEAATAGCVTGLGPDACHDAHSLWGHHTTEAESLRPGHRSHPDRPLIEPRSVPAHAKGQGHSGCFGAPPSTAPNRH
ncbi:hypothetical protein GCM10010336_65120 [Streptomyces goshikiensis]|nr:hypothetical protein GCM10010336_65120 [Streptomyces goshikiensis]